MDKDFASQIASMLSSSTTASKKQTEFENYNMYSKKNDAFLGTVGLLPHTKDAMIAVLSNIFKVELAGSRTTERTAITTEDII